MRAKKYMFPGSGSFVSAELLEEDAVGYKSNIGCVVQVTVGAEKLG